ncbi:MAG: AmmeMemoRadiSam system protein A [Pelolinea sp.]|nr:AmmeMemoRadiSam system protein A [Pelolinea sp.]
MNRDQKPIMSAGDHLNETDKEISLKIAREAISGMVINKRLDQIELENYSVVLRAPGASFVTLTKNEQLRGCIGAIEAYQPFILDVQEHAVAAALEDYRFPPVRKEEIQQIEIEISHLTPMQKLDYSTPEDLTSKLRVNVDGVLIKANSRRATFLPQVWEKVPNPEQFLSQLCVKMGSVPTLWKTQKIQVFTYQVESFKET